MYRTKNYGRNFLHLCLLLFAFQLGTLNLSAQDDLYCDPEVEVVDDLYITHFFMNNVSNPSGNNGYTFYSSQVIDIAEGVPLNFNIIFSNQQPKYFAVYADWDASGDFGGAGELVASGFTTSMEVFGTINVPSSIGQVDYSRLRVITSHDPIVNSCGIFRGEVEDYPTYVLRTSDPDWDIVVSSGLYFQPSRPGNESECGYFAVEVYSYDCNTGAFSAPQNLHYHVGIYGPTPAGTSGPLTQVGQVPFLGNPTIVEIPLIHNNNTQYYSGANYTLEFQHLNADANCYVQTNGQPFPNDLVKHFTMSRECGVRYRELTDTENSNTAQSERFSENLIENEILLKPNPFKDQIELNLNLNEETETVQIGLFDLYGRQVLEQEVRTELNGRQLSEMLDVSQLPAGTYFIKIESEHFYHTEKLLKLH